MGISALLGRGRFGPISRDALLLACSRYFALGGLGGIRTFAGRLNLGHPSNFRAVVGRGGRYGARIQ